MTGAVAGLGRVSWPVCVVCLGLSGRVSWPVLVVCLGSSRSWGGRCASLSWGFAPRPQGLTACVTDRITQSEAAGHPVRVDTFVRHWHQEYRILCGQTIDETNTQEKSNSPKTKNLAPAAVTWVFRTFGNLVRLPRVVSRHAALCLPRPRSLPRARRRVAR